MLEREYKYMINEFQYKRIKEKLNFTNEFIQTNYYYIDDEDLLRKNHITVRIREKNKKRFLQVKYNSPKAHFKVNENEVIREEFSRIMFKGEEITCSEIYKITGVLVNNIFCIGSMKTIRNSIYLDEGMVLSLDKNNYLDVTDYELEIEGEKEINNQISEFLKDIGIINGVSKCTGKCTRFLHKLKEKTTNGYK